MKNFESSEKVFEAYFSQYTAGCFRQGDVVKFINTKKLRADQNYIGLQANLKQKLDDMIGSNETGDSVIIVWSVNLNPLYASNYEASSISIGYSQGGGRVTDIISIPGSLGQYIEIVDNGPNQVPTIPTGARRDYDKESGIKEVDLEKLEKNRTTGHAASNFDV